MSIDRDPRQMEERLAELRDTIEQTRREVEDHQRDIGPRESPSLFADEEDEAEHQAETPTDDEASPGG